MKKGISLVSLAIIIIILVLFSSVVVISSKNYIKSVGKTIFVTDYMLVQKAVEKYHLQNDVYPINGTITLNVSNNAEITQFEDENVVDGALDLQKIDYTMLGYDDLNIGIGADETDFFAVSLATGAVYYVKGYAYDGKVYYTVTEDLI